MPMRNPLAGLVRRNPEAPTLRQRAASLKAAAARVIRKPVAAPAPEPVEAAEPAPDPIFAAMAKSRALQAAKDALYCGHLPDAAPEWGPFLEAYEAWGEHLDGVLTETVPTTAAGCVALARFAVEFHAEEGVSITAGTGCHDENLQVLRLIAQSPAVSVPGDDAEAAALVDAIEEAWAAYWVAETREQGDTSFEAEERIEPYLDRCNSLVREAEALPATSRAARHAKALAHALRDAVELVRGKPRADYDLDLRLVFDINASLAGAAVAPAFASPDAELLALGRQFEEATGVLDDASAKAEAAEKASRAREPERPECLWFSAKDHGLSVCRDWTHPEALNGRPITNFDVDRLRRIMPMRHEVLRPVRDGERAHIDHPGRKFDIVFHPEAQARAEEIVAAYDRWEAECARIRAEACRPKLEAAYTAAAENVEEITNQISAIPASTAAGLKLKLRVLLHHNPFALPKDLPEMPDPDQILGRSLRADALRDA